MTWGFTVITMKARNGATLYLKASSREVKGKPYKILCDWTIKKNDAMYFNSDDEATNFANEYFKHFANWGLEDVWVNV